MILEGQGNIKHTLVKYGASREFDHVPRLTVVNQTFIELSLVQLRKSHDVTLVEPDRNVGCSGTKMATKGMKFCPSKRKYASYVLLKHAYLLKDVSRRQYDRKNRRKRKK